MTEEEYMKMLYTFNWAFDRNEKLIIEWKNGLKVRCTSLTGVMETDIEPDDEKYAGDYSAAVVDVEILHNGSDDSVYIYMNDAIEISLKCIPIKISTEGGKVLWQE